MNKDIDTIAFVLSFVKQNLEKYANSEHDNESRYTYDRSRSLLLSSVKHNSRKYPNNEYECPLFSPEEIEKTKSIDTKINIENEI